MGAILLSLEVLRLPTRPAETQSFSFAAPPGHRFVNGLKRDREMLRLTPSQGAAPLAGSYLVEVEVTAWRGAGSAPAREVARLL